MRSKFKWIFTLLLALSMQFSFAQQDKTVSGVVSDATGPLPGANVQVQGTTRGTSTDADGKFSIKAKSGDVLEVSFVGAAPVKVTVGGANTYNVKLMQGTNLENVVVTALGIKKSEKAIGYAAQSVKGSALTEARESNLVNALSGRIAGVQVTATSGAVGSSSRIVLRGNSSITGNNQALFVVDGVPFDNTATGNSGSDGGRDLPNGVASISPDDIESVTVLKGPNAAALYGLRASNGVIIITTKTGKKSKELSVVGFNTNIAFSDPLVLPSYQNSYGQGTGPEYFEFVDGSGSGYADGVDESWGPALDKGLSFVQWDSFKYGGKPTPWVSRPNNVKDFYETGIAQTNNISLSAGGENSNFRMSLNNSNEKGMVPFTDFKKISVSLNGNIKLGERLNSGASLIYFNDKSNNLSEGGYSSANPQQQFIWSGRNVNFRDLKDWRNFPLNPAGSIAAGTPLNWNNNYQNNPYWVLENNKNDYNRDRLTGSVFLTYEFAKNLSGTGKVMLDQYSQIATNIVAKGTNGSPDGSYLENVRRYSEINTEFIMSYKTNIGKDFKLSLNAGGNQLRRISTQIQGFIPALELPNFYNLSNLKSGSVFQGVNNYQEQRIGSVLGFGQLSYDDIFFVDFSGRNDWASVLPVDNNSFFYPAVSGSIVLNDVLNIDRSKISLLKLRGGWSKVGGTGALSPYNLNKNFAVANNGFGIQASVPTTLFNANLKPEAVVGVEYGLDLRAFNNRLHFEGTYYTKKSSDLLIQQNVSAATGFTFIWGNFASMDNRGIEIQLGGTVLKAKDFTFDVDVNFAKNENKVVSLGGLDSYLLGGQWGVTLEARPGNAYGDLVGRGFERDTNGNVIYENGLPKIDGTRKVLGNITPDWTGGASFNIAYKNFDLSTLVDAKVGGDVHSMTYAWGRYAGTLEESLIGRETGVVGNGVKSDGAGGFVKNDVVVGAKAFNQYSYGNTIEESAIFDATYVKLRSMTLGYSLPSKWLRNSAVSGVKFSVVARNLAILYKKAPHIDPETGFSSGNGEQGQEFGQIPSARSYGFNVNVKF
jgi:TonB-linked SusC/RagA family outer membrane protein